MASKTCTIIMIKELWKKQGYIGGKKENSITKIIGND